MVIGVLIVRLEKVVVNVLCGKFYPDPADPEGLEFEHGERSRCILQQGVINLNTDLFAGNQFTLNQMGFQYLMSKVLFHGREPLAA
jgi:hypothetical protein